MSPYDQHCTLVEQPVHIGEILLGTENHCLSSILGSCVAVVLINAGEARFTMSHSLLPEGPLSTDALCARWVDQAVSLGLELLDVPQSRYWSLQAIVAGGAHMMGSSDGHLAQVGALNIEMAQRSLDGLGIPVTERDVGGTNGRRIVFRGDTQACSIQQIPRSVWT